MMEVALGQYGVLTGLAVLLAEQNKGGARGGGDLHPWTDAEIYGEDRTLPVTGREDYLMAEIVGRWAGDRVSMIGDYWEESDPAAASVKGGPWNDEVSGEWTDISEDTLAAMELDYYLRTEREEQKRKREDAIAAHRAAMGR